MKHLFRSLAIVLFAGLLLLVACKNDKKAANCEAVDEYIENHSYVCALADDAQALIKLDLFSLLEKSELMTAPEFEEFRESLSEEENDEVLDMMSVLSDPYQMGLDEKNPVLISISNVDPEEGGDAYIAVPLSSGELFIQSINVGDEMTFIQDEDGDYYDLNEELAAVVRGQKLVVYIPMGKEVGQQEMLSRAKAAVAKTSLKATLPGMDAFFTGGDDVAFWASNEDFYKMVRSEVNDSLRKELGISFEDVVGGDPSKGTASMLTLNALPGLLAMDSRVFGDNPVVSRVSSWSGKPERELLRFVPRDVDVAGLLAFQNLSDVAAFAQTVMNQIPDLQGYQIKDLLPTVGLTMKDLDEIGTVAFGVDIQVEGGVLVARVGENVEGAIQRALNLARVTPVSHQDWKLYQPVPGFCLLLKDGLVAACDSRTIADLGADGYNGGRSFLSNPLSAKLIHGLVVDGNSPAIMRVIDEQLPVLNDYLSAASFNLLGSNSARLTLDLEDEHVNAAKTLLLLVKAVSSEILVDNDYESDDELWAGYEELMLAPVEEDLYW